MRLIIPVVIILLGSLVGAAVCYLFKQTQSTMRLSLASGAAGAFAGLVIRDAMDITAGGPAGGALIAAVLGAVIASGLLNIYFKLRTA
ncbi:MAG: hypothetical protein KTR32_35770 [Granulosicoccus sp.]|nr:hypothetical protein [Granulosicoccus sp.]